MIRSLAADSAGASYPAKVSPSDTSGSSAESIYSSTELAAVQALAEHLQASPVDVDYFVHHAEGIPAQVLLSWICVWDLRRRNA